MPAPFAQLAAALGRRLAASLGGGAVALVLSEFVFLNEGPVATLRETLATPVALIVFLAEFTLIYAVLAYVARVAIWGFGANGWAGLVLGGAFFGWLIEGVIIPLVYEAPPLSFLWPSLGWHMVVTFGIGWVALPHLLRLDSRMRRLAALCAGGVGWALWARLFHAEDPGLIPPEPGQFAAVAGVTGALLIAGLWVMERPGARFAPTRWDALAAGVLSLPLAGLMAWSAGPASLGLLAMVALSLWAMARLGPSGRTDMAEGLPARAYAEVIAFPATAAVAFALLPEMPEGLSFVVVLPLTFAATCLWALAVLKAFRAP